MNLWVETDLQKIFPALHHSASHHGLFNRYHTGSTTDCKLARCNRHLLDFFSADLTIQHPLLYLIYAYLVVVQNVRSFNVFSITTYAAIPYFGT